MSFSVGHRFGSDLAWLWLWRRLAVAAPIQPLVSELPYAHRCGPKRKKKIQRKKYIYKVKIIKLRKETN